MPDQHKDKSDEVREDLTSTSAGRHELSLPRFDGHLEEVGYSHREVFDGEAEVHA
jgi:hypothetical protein